MLDRSEKDRYTAGLEVRRQVLGDDYVNASLDGGNSFREPLQDLITRYCWGEIWTRDQLDRKTRSLINLGILTALGRPRELAIHVRGAVQNGCTPEEIREVLLQTAIYCGLPAALDAFHVTEDVLEQE